MKDKVYTVYKTTNLINGKYYIGVHKTSNPYDDYIGSGKYLKRAIEKYGRENFTKEIIDIFETPEEAFELESQLVTFELIESKESYNLKEGGQGGFDYCNTDDIIKRRSWTWKSGIWSKSGSDQFLNRYYSDDSFRKSHLEMLIESGKKGIKRCMELYPEGTWKGRFHSDESKSKMRESKLGKYDGVNNPQYGKMWITDGINNKMIKKDDFDSWIEQGWVKGRKC